MTQSQIDRLRECKKKAMEIERELRGIYSDMIHAVTWHDDDDALRKNTIEVHKIYELSASLSNKLNATIL